MRVFRGGSFMTDFRLCRDAARNHNNAAARRIIENGLRPFDDVVGFGMRVW
jgi:hypothetical protein